MEEQFHWKPKMRQFGNPRRASFQLNVSHNESWLNAGKSQLYALIIMAIYLRKQEQLILVAA